MRTSKSERGLPVVAGFLSALVLLIYSITGLLHKGGIDWPLKYPHPGPLALPAAGLLMLGALLVFAHGTYFLFVLSPTAGPGRPRTFFRLTNWLGIAMVLGAGFVPDDILVRLHNQLGY